MKIQQRYVADSTRCPKCNSTDIEGCEIPEVDAGTCTQLVRCNYCNLFWRDIYVLLGYEVEETPDDIYK